MNDEAHWESVYRRRCPEQVGWYSPHLATSLAWIKSLQLATDTPMIDVGGGASTLVDDLRSLGYSALTVLDISASALALARNRLGSAGVQVRWMTADITRVALPHDHYRLWHDRAVFHFLTRAVDRQHYLDRLGTALVKQGYFLVGTFDPDAPPRCSGLPVQRYSRSELEDSLGPGFRLLRHQHEVHLTPSGVEQSYLYGLFEKTV